MDRQNVLSCMVALLLAFCHRADASTIIWPAAGLNSYPGSAFLIYSEAAGDAGGAGVDVVVIESAAARILQAEGLIVAVGSFWYETDFGEPVDADAVAAADPFAENFTGTLGSVDMAVDEVFYIAFWLDTDGGGAGGSTDVYGWVALVYDGTTLTLVDSAAETSGVGLYAGTYTPIPEPNTACLALTGLAVLAVGRRWRRRSRLGSS